MFVYNLIGKWSISYRKKLSNRHKCRKVSVTETAYRRPNQQPDTGSGIQIRYTFHCNHSSQSARKGTLLPVQESIETKTPSVLSTKILSSSFLHYIGYMDVRPTSVVRMICKTMHTQQKARTRSSLRQGLRICAGKRSITAAMGVSRPAN